MSIRWTEQHGTEVDGSTWRRWNDAYIAAGGVAAYTLATGVILALLRVSRVVWRVLVGGVSLVLVPIQLAITDARPMGLDLVGLVLFLPRMVLEGSVPEPSFTSACDVSFWRVRSHGFYPGVTHAVELSDGSVLLIGDVSRSSGHGPDIGRKAARLTADGRPDTTFTYDRGCLPPADTLLAGLPADSIPANVLVGPNGTFSAAWDAAPDVDGRRVSFAVTWRDRAGRVLRRPPFPADLGAPPQWGDPPLMRPTPAGGFVVAGHVGRGAAGGREVGVVRVLPDGRSDPAFTPWHIPEVRVDRGCADGSSQCEDRWSTRDLLVEGVGAWPDGHLLVLAAAGDTTRVVRLGPDGRPDTAFNRRATAAVGAFGPIAAIAIDAAGRPVLGRAEPNAAHVDTTGTRAWRAARRSVVRLRPDGNLDPGFPADSLPHFDVQRIAAQPSGHVLVWYNLRFATGADTAESRLVRLDPAGRRDRAFEATLGARAGGERRAAGA